MTNKLVIAAAAIALAAMPASAQQRGRGAARHSGTNIQRSGTLATSAPSASRSVSTGFSSDGSYTEDICATGLLSETQARSIDCWTTTASNGKDVTAYLDLKGKRAFKMDEFKLEAGKSYNISADIESKILDKDVVGGLSSDGRTYPLFAFGRGGEVKKPGFSISTDFCGVRSASVDSFELFTDAAEKCGSGVWIFSVFPKVRYTKGQAFTMADYTGVLYADSIAIRIVDKLDEGDNSNKSPAETAKDACGKIDVGALNRVKGMLLASTITSGVGAAGGVVSTIVAATNKEGKAAGVTSGIIGASASTASAVMTGISMGEVDKAITNVEACKSAVNKL